MGVGLWEHGISLTAAASGVTVPNLTQEEPAVSSELAMCPHPFFQGPIPSVFAGRAWWSAQSRHLRVGGW